MTTTVLSNVASRIMDAEDLRNFHERSQKLSQAEMRWQLLMTLNHQFFFGFIADKQAQQCYALLGINFSRMRQARYRSLYGIESASKADYWAYNH